MSKPRVILDSGAYTAIRQGKVIDIDKYGQFVIEHGHEFDGCFNLDSIGNDKKSYENWKYLQGLGAKTIPVFHMGTDRKYLMKYMDETDYVGIGAIANVSTEIRKSGLSSLWRDCLLTKEGLPKVKIHALGLTTIPIMIRYPWYSVDSFTPVISAVWGSVLLPEYNISTGKFSYLNMRIWKMSNQGEHHPGMDNSFLSLYGKPLMDVYTKFIENNGFLIGDLFYQEKQPRRGKKKEFEERPDTIFSLTKPPETTVKALANHWEERMRWNLLMWGQMQMRMPTYPKPFDDSDEHYNQLLKDERRTRGDKIIMYMGVSTTTHLEIFERTLPKLDILISYAYLSDKIYERIKNYVK